MSEYLNLLLVQSDSDDSNKVISLLKNSGFEVNKKTVSDTESFKKALNAGGIDAVISEFDETKDIGFNFLKLFNETNLRIPFIFLTEHFPKEMAEKAIAKGAHDYISKKNLERLVPALQRELKYLKESQEREKVNKLFNTVFQNASIGMKIFDRNGTIIDVNERYCTMLGYSRSELIGNHVTTITAKGEKQQEREKINYFFEHQDEAVAERRYVTNRGDIIDVMITSTKFLQDGEVFVFSTLEDITEEKRQRTLLKDTEKLAQLGGWERNLKTGEIIWTDSVYDIHEVDPDTKLTIEKLLDFYEPRDRGQLKRAIENITNTGVPYDLTLRMNGAKGTKKWVRVTANAIKVASEVVKLYGTIQDVTDGQRDKELLKQSLQEKIVLIKEIHHRVKNNLAVISGLLELQALGEKESTTRRRLLESQARIKSIAMIHEILYQNELFTSVQLSAYLNKLTRDLSTAYESEERNLTFTINAQDVSLNINQAVPFGILANEVITNAYKHAFKGREEGEIRVELYREKDQLSFSVSDNGTGFDQEILSNTSSLGITLINTLSGQLNTEPEWKTGPGGTEVTIRFVPEE